MTNDPTTPQQIPVTVSPAAPLTPQTLPVLSPGRMIGLGILGVLFGLILCVPSPRILIPLILETRHLFRAEKEHVQIGGTIYSPFTFFLRLDERKADVYPISRLIFNYQDSVRRMPLRGPIPGLRELTAINNPVEELPENIGDLTDLTVLQVMNGRLRTLPDSIGNLSNLEDLTLSGNRIRTLPDSIGELSNLRSLNLAYNDLESLPPSIGKLTKLEVLDVTGNRLKDFPHPIPPTLRWLIIGGNRIPIPILISTGFEWVDDIFY